MDVTLENPVASVRASLSVAGLYAALIAPRHQVDARIAQHLKDLG
jgi:hypothetical protein